MSSIPRLIQIWTSLWFQPQNTAPLEIVRWGIGATLLLSYGTIPLADLPILYSDTGFFSKAAVEAYHGTNFVLSAFHYLDAAWQLYLVHAVFLVAFAALTLGWRTSLAKWIALAGHLSYMNGNPMSWYGVDSITAAVLLLLCLGPTGSCFSLDRVRRQRQLMAMQGLAARTHAPVSPWGFACTRLIQIQMATLFFYSAFSKHGDLWLDGTAFWHAMLNYEIASFPPDFFAHNMWLLQGLTWAALALEMVYVVAIWPRLTRPFVLGGAILLHIGIIVFLDMFHFGVAMIFVHLAFVHHDWLADLSRFWVRRFGGMVMVYDGDCGFCFRSMTAFLAFDGLHQITARDYHRERPDWVTEGDASEAVFLRDAKGRIYAGFDAYRVATRRVPGLWWLVPLFHVPGLSAWVGRPLYRWIARNRQLVSRYIR